MVVQWSALLPHNTKLQVSWVEIQALSMWSLPPFLSKDMHLRLIGDSILTVGVYRSVNGCLSLDDRLATFPRCTLALAL